MSENKASTPKPETQHQRWLKYGANVGLVTLVVILLAVGIIWLAQLYHRQVDTTTGRIYSLKPQTINIISQNERPVRIVSLYTRTPQQTDDGTADPASTGDYAQRVTDLLDEYKRNGRNISVESIDPVSQPSKVDQLIDEVATKYGGEIKKYKGVLDEYPKTFKQISDLSAEEARKIEALDSQMQKSGQGISDPRLAQTLLLTIATVEGFPKNLESKREPIEKRLKQRPPDYKGAVESIEDAITMLSEMAGSVVDNFKQFKDDPKVPQAIRAYMAGSLANYEQIKKSADDYEKKIKDLGELKLDELRRSLREKDKKDAILVMGPDDMRVLTRDKVWQKVPGFRGTGDVKIPERFAGEQQITSAILSVTAKSRKKVAFVRAGGPPLSSEANPMMGRGGPFSEIANRLRDYNFDVVEKDLSGQWAMQAQMQGMPAAPEPSDDDIKDAVWIVLNIPNSRGPMPGGPMATKLAAHLNAGGSALVLSLPQADPLAPALEPWGVKLRTDALILHEMVKSSGGQNSNFLDEIQRDPRYLVTHEYGDHMITKPLRSLDGLMLNEVPVEATQKPGYKVARLLPIPDKPLRTWGDTKNLETILQGEPTEEMFQPPKAGDTSALQGPLYAGAAVEKDKGGRLVAIGSVEFAINQVLTFPNPDLRRQGVQVTCFPGNSELFCNSVFWLAKMDPMIAISPAAMEVSRVAQMSDGALRFWRDGVMLAGLPVLVILAGAVVYMNRRD